MGVITTKPPTAKSKDADVTVRQVGERVKSHFMIEPDSYKELGDGAFEAVITTSSLDRQGESITTAGISTDNYMQNPVVLYGHDYEGLPIGKATKLTHNKNKIKAQFQLAVNEYGFARTVADLIKGGYLNATSIGGIVKQWSDDYQTIEEMEMVEFSIVPVPANQEALMTARSFEKVTGKDIETIRAEFEDWSRKVLVDKLKVMPHDDLIDAVRVLKNLVARLEDAVKEPSLADAKPQKHVKIYVLPATKAVVTQGQRIIRTIKLSTKD